ncbi:MAG TPA: hypothetical protein VGM93_09215 [Acidimicrobiales bacterium]|jgi:hypothetical protein
MQPAARYPFPIPFGWFQVAYLDELEPGATVTRHYFGTVVEIGIGVGAARPQVVEVGGQALPVVVRNGNVLAWYHPEGGVPLWAIPEVEELAPDRAGLRVRTRYEIDACLQEITENGYDRAHLPHVHGTTGAHEVTFREEGDHRSWLATTLRYDTARGAAENRVSSVSWGPGVGFVAFDGAVDTVFVATTVPITAARSELRFQYLFRGPGSGAGLERAAQAFLGEIERQYRQDVAIWEHKAYLVRPALTEEEALILRFRRWYRQFYAEPVDEQRLRFVPPAPTPGPSRASAAR